MRPGAVLLIVQATLLPAGLAAQGPHVDLIPAAGYHNPGEQLGAAALIGNTLFVRVSRPDASAAFGGTAEFTRSGHRLGARLTGFVTRPATARTSFHCRPAVPCLDVLQAAEGEVATANLLADLVVALGQSGPLRQWVAVGGGLRRYDVSWDAPSTLIDAGSQSETIGVLHFGAGLDLRLGPGALRAEIGGLWSAEGDRVQPAEFSSVPATSVRGRHAQRDLLVSLGWRIARF